MAPTENDPITGLCIVADPEKCPPGYELIFKSFDKKDDCDLWKDAFFGRKVTRYLCITRVFPLESGRLNNVLGDIVLVNERDTPYPGFTLIDKTQDSSEQATQKKLVSVKMLPRNTTNDAITDLIILSKNKRAPPGYTLVGDVNGLQICYKMGRVPTESQTTATTSSTEETLNSTSNSSSAPAFVNNVNQNRPAFERQTSSIGGHDSILSALHDVPFVLGYKYQCMMQLKDFSVAPLNYKTLSEIDAVYNYPFRLERQAAVESL